MYIALLFEKVIRKALVRKGVGSKPRLSVKHTILVLEKKGYKKGYNL